MGLTQSWTVNGVKLTASGFYDPAAIGNPGSISPVDLYYNSTGDGASGSATAPGLGLASSNGNVLSVNHVIPNNGFIQFQFSGPVTALTLDMVGVTDYWNVYGTKTAGTLAGSTLLFTTGPTDGVDGSFVIPNPTGYTYYDVISSNDCESLLSSVTATVGTPEPATFALIGLALCAFAVRRKFATKMEEN
jgi:hypothetical protein